MTKSVSASSPADAAPENALLHKKIIDGLSRPNKALPCSLFYDARGSELFERITTLPEYYPTRTETAILERHAHEIAAACPAGTLLVEYGSGSSRKTEILLEALPPVSAYVPIDVSQTALAAACARLSWRFPTLRILAIEGDFTIALDLPPALSSHPRLGFFPGSTIGNFTPSEARDLLAGMAQNLGPHSRLLVGADLVKDLTRLLAAYNDADGVTAEFNLNLLVRLNREFRADFDAARFRHQAIFNDAESRIEMHLVSLGAQTVMFDGYRFEFTEGERLHTENSYKYTVPQFQALAVGAGWTPGRVWIDGENLFSVHELTRAD